MHEAAKLETNRSRAETNSPHETGKHWRSRMTQADTSNGIAERNAEVAEVAEVAEGTLDCNGLLRE
jgi:hypothetical protein